MSQNRLNRAIAGIEGECGTLDAALAAEVTALSLEMKRSMRELRLVGAGRIGAEDIPSANDELDAIVAVTASATGSILDACEAIEATVAKLKRSDDADALTAALAQIYAACGFQDLTGQRVGKIVEMLERIDRRIAAVCTVFGLDAAGGGAASPAPAAADDDSRLLNGPALPSEAMTQEEIDRVLAGLD